MIPTQTQRQTFAKDTRISAYSNALATTTKMNCRTTHHES